MNGAISGGMHAAERTVEHIRAASPAREML